MWCHMVAGALVNIGSGKGVSPEKYEIHCFPKDWFHKSAQVK